MPACASSAKFMPALLLLLARTHYNGSDSQITSLTLASPASRTSTLTHAHGLWPPWCAMSLILRCQNCAGALPRRCRQSGWVTAQSTFANTTSAHNTTSLPSSGLGLLLCACAKRCRSTACALSCRINGSVWPGQHTIWYGTGICTLSNTVQAVFRPGTHRRIPLQLVPSVSQHMLPTDTTP